MINKKPLLRIWLISAMFIYLGIGTGQAQKHPKEELTAEDKVAIQEVIQQQLEAFLIDDGEAAFALASPGIRAKFRTADIFLRMVKTSYQPVYRPQKVEFLNLEIINNMPVQILYITAQDDVIYQAYYPMELQQDKTWKTNGCYLVRTERSAI